mgnify:CR=1 FL=1
MTPKCPRSKNLISPDASMSNSSLWQDCLNALNSLANRLIQCLVAGQAPDIQSVRLSDGQILWRAYDPVTNTSFYSVTAADLSDWLDRR